MKRLKKISKEELKDILEKHMKWLNSEDGGERADLSNTDLNNANLYRADLSRANLSYASLINTDLSFSNLSKADLSRAKLNYSNLSHADFNYANLSHASIKSSLIKGTDFTNANLYCTKFDYSIIHCVYGFKYSPIQILNGIYTATIFDECVFWSDKYMSFEEFKSFKFSECEHGWVKREFNFNKKIINEMIKKYRK